MNRLELKVYVFFLLLRIKPSPNPLVAVPRKTFIISDSPNILRVRLEFMHLVVVGMELGEGGRGHSENKLWGERKNGGFPGLPFSPPPPPSKKLLTPSYGFIKNTCYQNQTIQYYMSRLSFDRIDILIGLSFWALWNNKFHSNKINF